MIFNFFSRKQKYLAEKYFSLTEDPLEYPKKLKKLQQILGFRFRNQLLLLESLAHKSAISPQLYEHEDLKWNERLEFLGDSVLGLAISTTLMDILVDVPEGELSKIRASIVNEASLANIARKIELGAYLIMGKGEIQTGGRDKDSLLANALEALLGAIYQDSGFSTAQAVIDLLFHDFISSGFDLDVTDDFKTRLQEITQTKYRTAPRYKVKSETGPDHAKVFEVEVWIKNKMFARGEGPSKKKASQMAAENALKILEKNQR